MKLLYYTRKPEDTNIYSSKLAYSLHYALIDEKGKVITLNHNRGVLFAKAVEMSDGTLEYRGLISPFIKKNKRGEYVVEALRVKEDGSQSNEDKEKVIQFISKDLIHFDENGMVDGKPTGELVTLDLASDVSLPKGCIIGGVLPIDDDSTRKLLNTFNCPCNIANAVPDNIVISSLSELNNIKAIAKYSDGSSVEKRVDWFVGNVPKNGKFKIKGKVHQDHYEFPIAQKRADPCIGLWEGKYYFIATNDADENHSLWIRCADSIPELVSAQEVEILDSKTYSHIGNLLWAPEFHIIQDRLYIFHAATPDSFYKEQCHVMALKQGGNPMIKEDWEIPRRVVKKDGTMLYGREGITLDMTEFEVAGRCYVCWSQRQFDPVDTGASLYIAEIDPSEPWKLVCDPILLSRPEYGWENNHTFVEEGPFALIHDDKVFLTYSGAFIDSTYVVGFFVADINADLLDITSWQKNPYPILTSDSVSGEYGTGHNAYVIDQDGLIWNTYHGLPQSVAAARCSGIRRVHFGSAGIPFLDMTESMDLNPEMSIVQMAVTIGD